MSAAPDFLKNYARVRALFRPTTVQIARRTHPNVVRIYGAPVGPQQRPKRQLGAVIYSTPIGPERNPKDVLPLASENWEAVSIVRNVCRAYFVREELLRGKCRAVPLVRPRHEIYYRLKAELGWSLPRIAKFMGCHHTTVLNGIRKHGKRLEGEG